MDRNPFSEARQKHNRNGFQTAKEVAEQTGVTKSLIDDLEAGSSRGVSYKTVAILAKHYGVPTDYLCGLSLAHTTDADIKMICDYTGLSQSAVEALHYATLPDVVEMDLPDVYLDKNGNVIKIDKNVPKTIVKVEPGCLDAEALNRRTASFINRVLERVHAADYEDGTRRAFDTIFSLMEDYVCSSGARIEDERSGEMLERVTVHYGADELKIKVRDLVASRMKEMILKELDALRDDHDAASKKPTVRAKARKEKPQK